MAFYPFSKYTKMKIAIDISPIDKKSKSAHKVRGVGKYITLLMENLEKFDKENEYIFTDSPKNLPTRVDIIHYPYFDPFFITLQFKNNVKTLVTVHDIIPLVHKKEFPGGIKGNLKWMINRSRLKNVDGIITDSFASKEDIVKVVGFNEQKIHVVHLSVDEEFKKLDLSDQEKAALKSKYGLPDTFLLYVGDVTWNKNLPRLVEAIKKVNVPLVMVGKALTETDFDTSNPWNADRLIIKKGTENDKLFVKLGFVPAEDLVKIYNLAQALVMPSLDEGFGLPILEAMKSGCPVITSNLGSIPEVAGDAALYVDAYNLNDIAVKIQLVVNEEKLRNNLLEKGLIRSEKFSLENMLKKTIAVYNSYLS